MDIRRQPESQNQNDSNDEQPRSPLRRAVIKDTVKVDAGNTDKDTVKDTDKVAVKDAAKVAVKNAIVSSVFVRLRTLSVSSICPSVVVGESGQSAVIEHFERLPWFRGPHPRHFISPYLLYLMSVFRGRF